MCNTLYFSINAGFTRARKTVNLGAWSFLNKQELGNSTASTHNCKNCTSLKQN